MFIRSDPGHFPDTVGRRRVAFATGLWLKWVLCLQKAISHCPMVLAPQVVIHPDGLSPLESVKAWYLHSQEGYTLAETAAEVVNIKGKEPGLKAVRNALKRVAANPGALNVETACKNCGRKKELTDDQVANSVAFVKKLRHKRFCTCNCVKRELKLKVAREPLQGT